MNAADEREPVVAVHGLTKRYGAESAVDDLSFQVRRGTIVGFLGPNGAGKTTTFRILTGLARATSGTAHVFGAPYRDLASPSRSVGAMLELAGFHPTRTGRRHLQVQARAQGVDDARVGELIELVGLAHAADRGVGGYSMGMRQRLGLAATLLGDPELLLLDEPANGLDPEGRRWLRDLLRSLSRDQGKTVVISSHVLAEVASAVDEVVIIRRGRFVTQGPIEAVTSRLGDQVVVRSPQVDRLVADLEARGGRCERRGEHELVVSGLSIEAAGEAALAAEVVLHGLWSEGPSLEEAFLALTADEATPTGSSDGTSDEEATP